MLSFITGPIGRWLAGAATAISLVAGALLVGVGWGGQKQKAKQTANQLDSVRKGIDGASKAKDALGDGKSPQDIVDGNNRKW